MSDGRILSGQQYDPEIDAYIPFTEQVLDYRETGTTGADRRAAALLTGSEGLVHSEQLPMDAQAARLRTFDITTVQTALDAYNLKWPGVISQIRLPDVLKGISVVYTKNKGEGYHTEDGNGSSVGTSSSLSLGLSGKSQSSLSINADIKVDIKRVRAEQIPVTNLAFYVAGSMTQAQLLAKCSANLGQTVLAWPVFQEEAHTLVVQGRTMSVSAEASVQQSVSISSGNITLTYGIGKGASYEAGLATRTIQIPPTIHGPLTLDAGNGVSDVITARASASWPAGGNWPARSSTSILTTDPIAANVSPTAFPATTPGALPTSGYYLYDVQFFQPKWSYARVHAIIVNFADIPNA